MGCGFISKETKIKTVNVNLTGDITKSHLNEPIINYSKILSIKASENIFQDNVKKIESPEKIIKCEKIKIKKKSEKKNKKNKSKSKSSKPIIETKNISENLNISGPIFNLLKNSVDKYHIKKNKH